MNVLFLSIGGLSDLSKHGIYSDLLRKFSEDGHNVYVVAPIERKFKKPTSFSKEEGIHILRVKIGNIKQCNKIEKGISTILIESQFKAAIKHHFADVKFDIIMYSTPPITFGRVIEFIKKRDNALSYLILKDIFPQNAVDLGMFSKSSFIYKFFRRKEKRLYALSDKIGCMSAANVKYVLEHNPSVKKENIEICPNSIDVEDYSITEDEKKETRIRMGIPLDKKVFVYGGNLGKPQGIDFFIKAINSVLERDDIFVLISGSGTEYGKIERFVSNCDSDKIKLMQAIPRADYEKLIASCDVGMIFLDDRFTIPNFPSRLISYLQVSLPVLAVTDVNSDIGTVATDGGFGWWCRSNSAEDFSKTVEQILNSDTKAMGAAGYRYLLDNYTARASYDIIMSHFDSQKPAKKETVEV